MVVIAACLTSVSQCGRTLFDDTEQNTKRKGIRQRMLELLATQNIVLWGPVSQLQGQDCPGRAFFPNLAEHDSVYITSQRGRSSSPADYTTSRSDEVK